MKLQGVIYPIIFLLLICLSCRNKENPVPYKSQTIYPWNDTIKIGIKSDNGKYVVFECYYKHIDEDEPPVLFGASEVEIGSQKWHIMTFESEYSSPDTLSPVLK